ncbi:MAG: DUF1549 domain-containing protein, partial [Gemmataceae bacterium]|nr:DUF1549 domain-containing protein [Gemmataceae bacterium]
MPSLLAALLLAAPDYATQVKPLLAARCFACHGALAQKGGLRLDTVASMRKAEAVVPGNSAESPLVLHVVGKERRRMPPPADGEHLKKEEIALLAAWIDAGAPHPADERPEADPREHWAFRPPQRPAMPAGAGKNPIDSFLAARMKAAPRPEADRRVLLRRAALGLTGLPPSEAEAEAFLADARPDAYERLVDRLLASPAYGERWGRHWLDVWRYSDWWGLGAEVRNSQKHIWRWRDWIRESLDADAGYDSMVRDMLAADELHPADEPRQRATGYLARSYFKFNRNTWLEEVVEHSAKGFLGLTMNCAKCHDHKYDPIAQEDFYRFRAFFEPYQVRTDFATSLDTEKDGVPRAFDCDLGRPTFLFIRGDEKNPRKKPIPPGLPSVFGAKLDIRAIPLPPEAHSPGTRPAMLALHLKEAEAKAAVARAALAKARHALAAAERTPPPKEAVGAAIKDDFAKSRPELWETRAGKWTHKGGKLLQESDAALRSVLRLKGEPPGDFDARLVFAPTGGKMWKSVGLAFDVADGNEVLVYLSAYEGGPKLQVMFKRGGADVYPPEGTKAMPVKLGTPKTLLVKVRGQQVEAEVDGKKALSYKLPVPRKAGAVEVV